jgi:hypothetical protein
MNATHDGTRVWKMSARDFFLSSTSAGFLTQHKRCTEQPAWFTERDAVGVAFEYAVLSQFLRRSALQIRSCVCQGKSGSVVSGAAFKEPARRKSLSQPRPEAFLRLARFRFSNTVV